MGISEKGVPLGIWNSTAGEPQLGHKARIAPHLQLNISETVRDRGLIPS